MSINKPSRKPEFFKTNSGKESGSKKEQQRREEKTIYIYYKSCY